MSTAVRTWKCKMVVIVAARDDLRFVRRHVHPHVRDDGPARECVRNSNQFYMAGLMTAAMAIIEVLVMSGMYPKKRTNAVLLIVSAVALFGFFAAIQKQTAISDRQFLRSMIPHHSGAILMCGQASLQDPELVRLCDAIGSQASEIALMTAKLRESGD